MRIKITKNYNNFKINEIFEFVDAQIDDEGSISGYVEVDSQRNYCYIPYGMWTSAMVSTEVTLVDIHLMNMADDLRNEVISYLEICNNAAQYYNVRSSHFKRADEVKKALIKNGVALDKKIYFH